jgi:hypothetical protein
MSTFVAMLAVAGEHESLAQQLVNAIDWISQASAHPLPHFCVRLLNSVTNSVTTENHPGHVDMLAHAADINTIGADINTTASSIGREDMTTSLLAVEASVQLWAAAYFCFGASRMPRTNGHHARARCMPARSQSLITTTHALLAHMVTVHTRACAPMHDARAAAGTPEPSATMSVVADPPASSWRNVTVWHVHPQSNMKVSE